MSTLPIINAPSKRNIIVIISLIFVILAFQAGNYSFILGYVIGATIGLTIFVATMTKGVAQWLTILLLILSIAVPAILEIIRFIGALQDFNVEKFLELGIVLEIITVALVLFTIGQSLKEKKANISQSAVWIYVVVTMLVISISFLLFALLL